MRIIYMNNYKITPYTFNKANINLVTNFGIKNNVVYLELP